MDCASVTPSHIVIEKPRHKGKKWRKLNTMAKNSPKTGHSVRRGNSPAPYTKYKKIPYQYSFKKKRVDYTAATTTESRSLKKAA